MPLDPNDPTQRLIASGWQSWSTGSRTWPKLPQYNYPPFPAHHTNYATPSNVALKQPAKGWCSWYCYGRDINETVILKQASWFRDRKLPGFQFILIDDGWEREWGDWTAEDATKFPSGLRTVAQNISAMGLKPGIWVAPFLVSPRSRLAQEHPQWLVRRGDKPLEGLRVTPLDTYLPYKKFILDVTQDAVVAYIEDVLHYLIDDCGFQLIKLDFLYGLYNNPKLSTAQADQFLHSFLLKIQQRYPAVYTIACGCPLLPAMGVVDSMRIGPDTLWPAVQSVPIINKLLNRHFHRQVMHNIASRSWTKRFWNLDYDAFVCRQGTGISDSKLAAQSTLIVQSAGNIFLGDDMTELSQKRIRQFIEPLFQQ